MTVVPPGACNCCTDCTGELVIGDPVVAPTNFLMQVNMNGGPGGGFYTMTVEVDAVNYTVTITVGDNQAAVQADYDAALAPIMGATCVIVGDWSSHTFEATGTISGDPDVNGFVDGFSSLTGGTDPFPDSAPLAFGDAGSAGSAETWHRLAWCLTDLSALWEEPIQRGVNVVIPGVAGRLEMPRWPDESDYALHLIVSGVVDPDGTLTDPAVGENEQLRRNLAYIRANMLNPAPPDTDRAAQLVSPDGATTLTGSVQYGDQPLVSSYKNDGLWIGTLHLVVPAGTFT